MFAASKSGSAAAPTDAQFNYVTMLLHGDGTNGAQNNTFVDSSTNNFTITRNGNTTQGTFSPYGSNWSNYFGGSDYITLSSAPISATGAFTFECWVFVTGTASSQAIYGQYLSANGGRFNMFWNDVANKFSLSIAATSYDSASTYTANAWYHIAWVRDGSNNLSLYVNGVRDFTTTGVSTSLYTGNPIIAARAGGAVPYTGYISNMRITNTAVYSGTSITVPTTPLTNISGTTLLTCQSNRFVDNETTPLTFTISGSPSVQRFSPFSPTTAYSTSVIGGSGYFDGTGDYLTAPDVSALQFGTGNFTIETWAYFSSLTVAVIFDQRASGPSTNAFIIYADTSGYLGFYSFSPSLSYTSNLQVKASSWNHIAFVRSGNAGTFYLNGVASSSTVNLSLYNNTSSANRIFQAFDPAYSTGYCSDFRIVKGTAVYTTNFTPNTTPLTAISGTSLLLNYTNAGIFDNAMMNDLETVGNAQISTSVKKYGTGSMYFDGSTSYLTVPNPDTVGDIIGRFTVECWVYFNSTSSPSSQSIISKGGGAFSWSSSNGFQYSLIVESGTFYWQWNTGGSLAQISVTPPSAGAWVHIAVTYDGTYTRLFFNGVQQGSSTTGAYSPPTTRNLMYIGARLPSGNTYPLNGYIDDLRITKGVARYTANFTPPTAAFPNN